MNENLHSFCKDAYGNLRLKYEKNKDQQVEYDNLDWLNEAGYQKEGESYVYPRTKSSVNFRNVI